MVSCDWFFCHPLVTGHRPLLAESRMNAAKHQLQLARLGELAGGEHFAEAFAFGLVVASDQHAVVGRRGVQFIADLADFAAEALRPIRRADDTSFPPMCWAKL